MKGISNRLSAEDKVYRLRYRLLEQRESKERSRLSKLLIDEGGQGIEACPLRARYIACSTKEKGEGEFTSRSTFSREVEVTSAKSDHGEGEGLESQDLSVLS